MSITQESVKLQSTNSQHNFRTIDDLQSQCLSHMAGNGVYLKDSLYADGKIHRFQVGLKKNKDGWYISWDGISTKGNHYLICIYGSWKTEGAFEYRSWLENSFFDEEERSELQRRLKEKRMAAETAMKVEQDLAAKECQRIWKEAENINPTETHLEYLKKKGVKDYGLRFGNNEKGYQSIIIPLKNTVGEIRSLQYISVGHDGKVYKCYHTGGEKKGNFFVMDSIANGRPFYVCEGYATGASSHEAVGHPVVVAFDCKNLLAVIENLCTVYPESKITILADDDSETIDQQGRLINPGKNAAEEGARLHGCDFILPGFPNDFKLPNGKCPTDFNDLHVHFGLDEVRRQLTKVGKIFDDKPSLERENSSLDDWPEPGVIKAALYPVPSFNSETLLPEALHDWVMDEANRMPCPPDFIASAVIVSLGAVIGAQCAIKPKSNDPWLIVPNLWGGIVGLPSTKKSPAIGTALNPLGCLIARAIEKQRAATGTYEVNKTVFEAKKKAFESRITEAAKKSKNNDLDSMAKELLMHQQNTPDEPILRRYKSNDTTVEKLGELLRDNPAGLLILRDELVGLIASWDKAGREGDRAFYLEAWNGNASFDTDRIGRGHIFIPNLCTSLFGGIQPDKLTIYLQQSANALANDGMLQRFQMLVYPDHRPWEWCDFIPNKAAREKAYAMFDALETFDPVAWGAFPKDDYAKFPHFQFDEEAQKIFIEWSTDLNRVRLPNEDNPLITQHLAKYEKLFSALALIFHLIDCTSGNCGSIKARSAWQAAAWCKYLEAHARRCYGLLADDGLRSAQALADKICKLKLSNGFTARDVRRNQWRYLTTDEAVQAALDWLEKNEGWLRSNEIGGTGPGTGRRTYRYEINPKLKKLEKLEDSNDELA